MAYLNKSNDFSLGGTTFHRGLGFSWRPEYLPLDPENLNRLRQQFENMFVVIIGITHIIQDFYPYHLAYLLEQYLIN